MQNIMRKLQKNNWAISCAAMLLVGTLPGCGSSSEDDNPTSPQPSGTQQQDEQTSSKPPQPGTPTSNTSQENKKKKYVEGIPYDVFYDRPLQIAADNTMLAENGKSPSATTPQKTPPTTSTPGSEPAPKTGTEKVASWDDVISHDSLKTEIKQLRNRLNAKLNSVGNFNRELLSIQIDAATLAAMAGIVAQHSGDFTWKAKAKYVRDFSSTIATAAETRGRPAFEKAEKPFLNIIEILDGGSPAELPESDEETVFSDVADRNLLMKNIKEKQDWLRTTISNEAEMKSNQEEVLARASLLAAIGQVVNQEDYVFADEKVYQDFCNDLVKGSLLMTEGVKEEDFSKYEKGFSLFNKSCTDCHPKYLNN